MQDCLYNLRISLKIYEICTTTTQENYFHANINLPKYLYKNNLMHFTEITNTLSITSDTHCLKYNDKYVNFILCSTYQILGIKKIFHFKYLRIFDICLIVYDPSKHINYGTMGH